MMKGQANMEFMATYGWVFVFIIVTSGMLFYLGVLDVKEMLPHYCDFGTGIGCDRVIVYEDEVRLKLVNEFPKTISSPSTASSLHYRYSATDDWSLCGPSSEPDVSFSISPQRSQDIVCDISAKPLPPNNVEKIEFGLSYSEGTWDPNFAKTLTGSVSDRVEESPSGGGSGGGHKTHIENVPN